MTEPISLPTKKSSSTRRTKVEITALDPEPATTKECGSDSRQVVNNLGETQLSSPLQ